jgi:hypothetical protein
VCVERARESERERERERESERERERASERERSERGKNQGKKGEFFLLAGLEKSLFPGRKNFLQPTYPETALRPLP